jgi:hypothetical protein
MKEKTPFLEPVFKIYKNFTIPLQLRYGACLSLEQPQS